MKNEFGAVRVVEAQDEEYRQMLTKAASSTLRELNKRTGHNFQIVAVDHRDNVLFLDCVDCHKHAGYSIDTHQADGSAIGAACTVLRTTPTA